VEGAEKRGEDRSLLLKIFPGCRINLIPLRNFALSASLRLRVAPFVVCGCRIAGGLRDGEESLLVKSGEQS
jgi:hypothetical protein